MKALFFIILSALCLTNSLMAQQATKKDSTSMNRELTLEKEYNPTIHDASKLNTLPEIREPEAPKSTLEFANFSMPYDVKPRLSLLKSGSYLTNLPFSKKRGYAKLGIGSFVDVDADLGYQFLHTENDQLHVWGSHRSSNGNVKYLQNDSTQKMKINDTWGGIAYNHAFDNFNFFTDAKYTYSSFNYYGCEYIFMNSGNDLYATNYQSNKDFNQVNNILDMNLGVTSIEGTEFNYKFKFNYSNFRQKHDLNKQSIGPKENFFQLDLDFNKAMDSEKLIGFRGYYRGSSYQLDGKKSYHDFDSYSDFGLNPYLAIKGENWSARLGVLVDVLFNYGNTFSLAPDLEFNFKPQEHMLLYLHAKGGMTDNSLKNTYYENRYESPYFRVKDSRSPFDATLGFKSSVGNIGFNVFGGYKNFKDEHFYYQEYAVLQETLNESISSNFSILNFSITNRSTPNYRDGGVFKVGGDLKYTHATLFELALKATYYSWDLADIQMENGTYFEAIPFNKPTFEMDFTASYNLAQFPLRFDLNYHVESGRQGLAIGIINQESLLGDEYQTIKMKNINELRLKSTYTFTDAFSAYLQLNNLLFQRYDLWYGYPAQGFNVMGGVSLLF